MLIEKVIRRISLPMLGSVLCLSMCGRAYAKDARADIPDLNRRGSISVEMRANDTGEAVPGGTMTLYMTGRYVWLNNIYQIRVEDDFVDDIYSHYIDYALLSSELAQAFINHAEKNDIEGETKAIDENGKVSFKELKPGLYLLAQKEPPEGYYSVNPFFVTLPLMNSMTGVYDYDIDATPKTHKLEPVIKPAPLEPAYHDMAELKPAYHDMAEIEPALPYPAESETSPASPESNPGVATSSDAEPDDKKHPSNATGHGGSGGDIKENTGIKTIDIEGEIWEITPMPRTGERRNLLTAAAIFALSGLLLAVIAVMRYCKEKKFGRR